MRSLGLAGLLGAVALLGNLTVDWLTHAKPAPAELTGASIIGLVLGLGFSYKAIEVVNLCIWRKRWWRRR